MSPMREYAYVYIMSSSYKRLYIGITTALEERVHSHKTGRYENSFTARYKIDQLVYFERYGNIQTAIAREKQLKRWSQIKKVQLIVQMNPVWRDLSLDWGVPIEPVPEPQRPPSRFAF